MLPAWVAEGDQGVDDGAANRSSSNGRRRWRAALGLRRVQRYADPRDAKKPPNKREGRDHFALREGA